MISTHHDTHSRGNTYREPFNGYHVAGRVTLARNMAKAGFVQFRTGEASDAIVDAV
jgi:hypothetical protein